MTRPTVYLFAGDSLTTGSLGESYVARIAAAFNQGEARPTRHLVNAGRDADTLRALLARIDQPLQQHQPDWVVLAIGINDVWLSWLAGAVAPTLTLTLNRLGWPARLRSLPRLSVYPFAWVRGFLLGGLMAAIGAVIARLGRPRPA